MAEQLTRSQAHRQLPLPDGWLWIDDERVPACLSPAEHGSWERLGEKGALIAYSPHYNIGIWYPTRTSVEVESSKRFVPSATFMRMMEHGLIVPAKDAAALVNVREQLVLCGIEQDALKMHVRPIGWYASMDMQARLF